MIDSAAKENTITPIMSLETEEALNSGGKSCEEQKCKKNATANIKVVENEDSEARLGQTPSGQIFVLPHDPPNRRSILETVDFRVPKTPWDLVVDGVILAQVLLFFVTSGMVRRFLMLGCFFFWRVSYDAGIGYLLHKQSHQQKIVDWIVGMGFFDKTNHPKLYEMTKRQLKAKMDSSYDFENSPVEFNAWLVFRHFVDLVLMCDFCSYVLMACAWLCWPKMNFFAHILRIGAGYLLLVFNLWVKMDAHRVVRDYAWYWGDFFFRLRGTLVFNGVFELAPHPMYSIGYAGYYGMSLITGSYMVLFASIVAHMAQFAFLLFVENPHIARTYGSDSSKAKEFLPHDLVNEPLLPAQKDTVVFFNFDITRVSDVGLALLSVYSIVLVLFTPNSNYARALAVGQAFIWRVAHSLLHGFILSRQSKTKAWTRHFISRGNSALDAWAQWKGLYNLTLCMSYITFIMASWKMYSFPTNWIYGSAFFRHVLGLTFIALHIYTSVSIFDDLGNFGWFYGDFFLPVQSPKLSYRGIYRYLNNPERFFGSAAFWGMALISNSSWIFFLALLAQVSTLGIIRFVEKPHMQRIYGSGLRKEAGVEKTIKQATLKSNITIPTALKQRVKTITSTIDKVIDQTAGAVEEFLDTAGPKVHELLHDTSAHIRYQAQLSVLKVLDPHTKQLGLSNYGLEVDDLSDRKIPFGAPIRVKWNAPANHSTHDWIGLYRVGDNPSTSVTQTSSQGRWSAVQPDVYSSHSKSIEYLSPNKDSGVVCFSDDLLFWKPGMYEFRYHHSKNHVVMTRSQPFEIVLSRCDSVVYEDILTALKPIISACLPGVDLEDSKLPLEDISTDQAKRIVLAIRYAFKLSFEHRVVKVDGKVSVLARRISKAKKILQSFSDSFSAEKKTA
ncbi:phosphatidylethanolamine N-methyltransferase Cho2 [Schizosaccharomyces japonicus yFS275]|uniref:Phosphatidylethanolamine N-methyltransferase n=1 Tax=Schizosaccharomyces japonicus (strain yFS275 / FY16936) TaxID=402676 RepID=CHO2_SCHJY|nr:phosphatidylethanolamine N-methyltransferase Cho2 [Schizosaccharomyces japonicus yFS275]B6JWP7.1 RecName: Full=Phosphatidylethanolamine N-methyltransferase; Short=PE methyltransferase; Short=PEAMT; Short=PEMT [Schizosaccharomyces japonicus yFS275]EEB05798.1 phosphatidylethanolamine N-methyltransferase Cho2 [Schizosaccharomyces japonicus yFS275]